MEETKLSSSTSTCGPEDYRPAPRDKIKESLDFLSSFCGIMTVLGQIDGLKEVGYTDIETFASWAEAHVCFLKDHIIKD